MDFRIRKSQVKDSNGYWEFDFNYDNRRIRRKMQCTSYQANLLCELLQTVIPAGLDRNKALYKIDTNGLFYPEKEFLVRGLDFLLFNQSVDNPLSLSEIRYNYMEQFFPIEKQDVVICLLGKAGVGKSTIIKKMSVFWDSDLEFPFTDISRTTTFSSDYRFVKEASKYRLIALLRPFEETIYNICECIDRAVNKYFECRIKNIDDCDTLYNETLSTFVNDPNNLFDIRYSIGKFLRTTSKHHMDQGYGELRALWADVYGMIRKMCELVLGKSVGVNDDAGFYNFVFSEEIKNESRENDIYNTYSALIDMLKWHIGKNEKSIQERFADSTAFQDFHFDNDDHSCLSCYITDINHPDVKALLRMLAVKKAAQFGFSLLNRIEHMRIDLPYNAKIDLPKNNLSFVMRDTIGIAHNPSESRGFEDSTNLNFDNVDILLLVDDAKFNGENNFSTILEHVIARVDPSKIFYAYTFFDDFSKADFDEEDDIEAQKISYLIGVTRSAINQSMHGKLFDQSKFKVLTSRLNPSESFFLSGLMEENNFDSINKMLDVMAAYKLTGDNALPYYKIDDNEPLIKYDYKKIPLVYQRAVSNFYELQDRIYQRNPPHFKTTEALTLRLSYGKTYFIGARALHPVDDYFDCIIKALSSYLDVPEKLNFRCKNEEKKSETAEQILGNIKTNVTERLRKDIVTRFTSPKEKENWRKLYLLFGTGSDLERRDGIIDEERRIGSSVEDYLNSSDESHMINFLENAIKDAVASSENNED